jgi:hypothetical protein
MTTNTNPAFKLLIAGRRRAGMSLAEHYHHILEQHGKMVLKLIASNPDHAPRRYAQNRVVDGTWRAGGPAGDPFALNRDFVTQVWFDNPAQAMDALSHPLYKANLQPDEDRFVDQATVVKLAVRERLLGQPAMARGPFKLFAFFSKAAAASSADFASAWQQRGDALAASSAASLFQHYVQNHVMAKPGETPWVDGVDEFWVADRASAATLVEAVKAVIAAPLLADGWLAPGADFHLVAEESLLFAGTLSAAKPA